jgi:hypothetical protein
MTSPDDIHRHPDYRRGDSARYRSQVVETTSPATDKGWAALALAHVRLGSRR